MNVNMEHKVGKRDWQRLSAAISPKVQLLSQGCRSARGGGEECKCKYFQLITKFSFNINQWVNAVNSTLLQCNTI